MEEGILMAVRKHLNAADVAVNSREFASAKTSVEEALQVARQQEHTPSLAAAYYAMASVIWSSGGTAEDAHRYASLAAQHTKANTSTDLLVRTLVGRIKTDLGHFDAAEIIHKDLLKYYLESEREDGQADCWRSLGDLYRMMGEITEARHAYQESMRLFKKLDDPLNYTGLLLSLGALMYHIDHRVEARDYWQEAHMVAEAQGFRHLMQTAQEGLDLLNG